jgi:hypothetical protein
VKLKAKALLHRIGVVGNPSRPWLHITTSPRVARFLIAAGARPGSPRVTGGSEESNRGTSSGGQDSFAVEISAEPGREATPDPRLLAELLSRELRLNEWGILRWRVTNAGKTDVSDLQVVLHGQLLTAERGGLIRLGQLAAGASADLGFEVQPSEAGTHMPVRLNVSYWRPDGSHRAEVRSVVRVVGDRVVAGEEPMTILFLGANPPGMAPLRIDEEIREIRQGILPGGERDRIHVETRSAARPYDISRALVDVQPRVVHFVGLGEGGEEGFAAENEAGKPGVVPVAGLVELFAVAGEDVRCVLVHAPGSEQLARGLSSVLPRASVIAMLQPVGDRSAITFSVGFYKALAEGTPVERAFRLGQALVAMERDSSEDTLLFAGDDATGVNS